MSETRDGHEFTANGERYATELVAGAFEPGIHTVYKCVSNDNEWIQVAIVQADSDTQALHLYPCFGIQSGDYDRELSDHLTALLFS